MGKSKRGSGIAKKRPKKETIGNDHRKRVKGTAIDSVSIPMDLIIEILVKLPPKSIAKFICVSKLWSSIIRGKDFTDLFFTRSLTRPLFLFAFNRDDNRIFLSVSQEEPYSGYQTSPNITPSRSDTIFRVRRYATSPPIRGLICCQVDSKVIISNPSTGQIVYLPKVKTRRKGISSFLGYDPVKDEYKVLTMTVSLSPYKRMSEEHQVFSLGKAQKTWRMIDCKHPNSPVTTGICNNGVVYYGAKSSNGPVIVGFNVNTEEFTLANLPAELKIATYHLVSYNRKIALVIHHLEGKIELFVLEDFEKQEWSKMIVQVPSWRELVDYHALYCRGTISSGELIFSPPSTLPDPFFIVMYDQKKDIARKIEMEGFHRPFHSVEVFLDHVECSILL